MSRSYIRATWLPASFPNRRKHSNNYRRPNRPYRSCWVCHSEKIMHVELFRDKRLKQDDIDDEIQRYFDEAGSDML